MSPWAFTPRPTVWLLIAGLAALYWWAMTRIGPRATREGERVVTGRQVAWFVATLAVLWAASDWPIHDIGEGYLYSVHMVQHLLLTFVVAPMAWLATPTWLLRLVVGSGLVYRTVRRLARPVPATLVFNAVVVLTHWPALVNVSVTNGPLHYGVHLLVVASALLMWLPIAGPLPELRLSLPGQMVYLFLQSIIPTVPAGWLTMAEGTVYRSYEDAPLRLWGWSVATDQQTAGLLMKIGGTTFIWTVIAVLFVRFATRAGEDDRASGMAMDRRAPVGRTDDGEILTWEQVERALATAPPAPSEPQRS